MPNDYERRLKRVMAYIHAHPGDDLSLDRLADVAALSRFHWHRIFHAMTGETCAQAVRRIRLHRAAFALLKGEEDISTVALHHGYPNRQSFERAFRQAYGHSPTAFRARGVAPPDHVPNLKEHTMFPVKIMDQPARRLAGITYTGPYHKISEGYDQLTSILSSRGLWSETRGLVALYFDDPTHVAEEELKSFAAVAVTETFETGEPLERHALPGGRHAVLHHSGPYTTLKSAWDYLYGQWMGENGVEPDDTPPFEFYHNSPLDTVPSDLRTDICVRLR